MEVCFLVGIGLSGTPAAFERVYFIEQSISIKA